MRTCIGVLALTGAVSMTGALAAGQEAERQNPIVAVHDEPHHRQIFQRGPVRILDLQIPPGDMSWFHTHEHPVLYVTLGTSRTRTQNLGEEWGGGRRSGGPGAADAGRGGGVPPGEAAGGRGGRGAAPVGTAAAPRATSTTSYARQPITHRLENIGDGLFRAMVVINETPGDEATPEAAAGFAGTPELTNRWFRAYRIVLEAGQKTESHTHKAPVAVFQATAGKALGAGAMTWEFNEPGQWAYFDPGDRHEIRNAGDGRVELIEVEVRGR